MMYETILFEIRENVAYITLNRPDAANGVNIALGRDLMHAAIRCSEDPQIRAVLLTGRGKMFCAGGDLRCFVDAGEEISNVVRETTFYCHNAASCFMRMNAPLVTAVNGAAAGVGMSFALSGDIIVAAESAFFAAAYTAVGLSPDGGMTYLLPRKIGLVRTKDLILNNRRLTAREALEWGLVNKVVPDDELMKEAEDIVKRFAKGPTLAYGTVKKLLNETFSETLESQMEHESRGITDMTKTKDGTEGIAAFLERKRPSFTGS